MQLHFSIQPVSGQRLRVSALPTLVKPSWSQRTGATVTSWFASLRERRRVQRAYHRDLRTLAGMSERDLADFCAPCWLRSDVARLR